MAHVNVTRREVLTQAAYMAPAIVTLPVLLSFASAGSGNPGNSGGSGNPGNSGGSGNPGNSGHEGKHKGGLKSKHYGWE